MNVIFSVMSLISLLLYYTASSFLLFFVPRWLRRKKNIKGQRVLITGAGSGVGRELAIEFSKHATCLVLVDINRQSLLQTEKLLDRRSTTFIYECDVSDYGKVREMARRVREEAGDVDILVNNAGIVSGKHLVDLSEEQIVRTMSVNTLAHFWTCKAFLPAMMEKNRGHVVSMVSVGGKCGGPRLTDYCSSKFGAYGFAESLEVEMRERKVDGIKVTIVCPTHIDTGLFEGAKFSLATILTPEYVAEEVVVAVLEEQETIFLPHFFRYVALAKELFPRWFIHRVVEATGDIDAMAGFTGRQSTDVESKNKPCDTEMKF